MPTRRIMELIVITGALMVPAVSAVKFWGKRQVSAQPDGSFMHTLGEVVVTLIP